jgi:hypothetical protein
LSTQHGENDDDTKSGVSTNLDPSPVCLLFACMYRVLILTEPQQRDSQFEKHDEVQMMVYEQDEDGVLCHTSRLFIVCAKRQQHGYWQYQLKEVSGEDYKADDWFSESDLKDA